MKEKITFIAIPLLLLILLGLGYLVFQNYLTGQSTTQSEAQLAADQKKVLNVPTNKSSEQVRADHSKLVAKLAKFSKVVTVKDCRPTPLVVHLRTSAKFTIKNLDKTDINIVSNQDHAYNIPAGGSQEVTADFGFGNGVYGYYCFTDAKRSYDPVGIFWVTP